MKIGVVNNKGGVLKTTISTNLGASFSFINKKVLIIDLDGQGNVAATFGKKPENLEYSIIDFLKGECTLENVIIKISPYLHLLPSNDELNYFDFMVSNKIINQYSLKILINKMNELYDYVFIDTPPAMSVIVATVLSIVDQVIIPFEPDQYAILGLRRIINAAQEFKKNRNLNLKIVAIPTKVQIRTTIHKDILEKSIRPKLLSEGIYVTNCFISTTTKSTAAVGYEKVPLVLSVLKNKYQNEYHQIRDELLQLMEDQKTQ